RFLMLARVIVEGLLIALLALAAGVIYVLCFQDERSLEAREGSGGSGERAVMTQDREHFLTHDGRKRRYLVHVPKNHDGTKPLPVVLGFHGSMARAESFRLLSRLNEAADRHGFLAVYPDGTGRTARMLTWNAELCCGYAAQEKVDDV